MVPEDRFRLVPEGGYGDVGSQGFDRGQLALGEDEPGGTEPLSGPLAWAASPASEEIGVGSVLRAGEPGTEGNVAVLGKGTGRRPGRRPAASPP